MLNDRENSPVPTGWLVGGVGYTGSSPYQDGKATTTPIPGAIYIGKDFMYLGDRAFYTFARTGPVSYFGRVRVRLGNLDPKDSPQFTGLQARRWQAEAGLGAALISPVGLWTARFSSDVSGRSGGSEWLLNWSAPLVHERWLLMPSVGVLWRQAKLANYYFGGVSAAESSVGRPAYDVGNAWSLAPSLLATYRINAQWMVGGVLAADLYSGAIKDSPLVQKWGRYDVLLGLGYVWR